MCVRTPPEVGARAPIGSATDARAWATDRVQMTVRRRAGVFVLVITDNLLTS
jgi:hypothetical protein